MCRGICVLGFLPVVAGLGASAAAASPAAGPSPAAAASPATAATGLRAFVLAGAPDSFADLQTHGSSIAVAYPTYFHCAGSGSQVLGHDEPVLSEYVAAQGIVLMPRYTCQDGAQVHRLLHDRSLRAHLLSQLLALAREPPYRGLSLDLENDGAGDRGALTSFVAVLARALHASGRRLSVVVDGVTHEDPRRSTYFYDERRLSALADEVFVMAWGVHWEGSGPGPLAPIGWVRQVARFAASLPYARRFVLGAPMYGLDWPANEVGAGGLAGSGGGLAGSGGANARARGGGGRKYRGGKAYQYAGLAALAGSAHAAPRRDNSSGEMTFAYVREGVRHVVWYLDARAVAARLRIGLRAGFATGVWRLGSEDQSLWSSLP
jgi:spore germination protein YaaH